MTDADGTAAVVRRSFVAVAAALGAANLVGAVISFVYLALVSPVPPTVTDAERREVVTVYVVVFVVFMLVALPAGGLAYARRLGRAGSWAIEGRPPTPAEADRVLRLPRTLMDYPAVVWTLAVVVFGGVLPLVFDLPWRLGLRIAAGILVAAVVTITLAYLVVEWTLRPVAAVVLAYGVPQRPPAPGILPRVVVSWLLGGGLPLLAVGLTQVFRTPEERQHLSGPIWYLVLTGLVTGSIAISVAAASIAEPIRAMRAALREVQQGRFDVTVPVDDASEVGQLQAGFNEMVAGLQERTRLEDLFGRHVGEDVARQAVRRGVALGGEARDVSVLFVDVVGSTALAESRDPAEVVLLLNDVFAAVVESARAEGGWVNKFAGDGALCVFGAPADLPGHATAALRAARRMRSSLARLAGVDAGIGVSCGTAVAGNVGARERFEYTVIGDPVNEAARLSELAKSLPGRVAASATIVAAAEPEEAAGWRRHGRRTLRGRRSATEIRVPAG